MTRLRCRAPGKVNVCLFVGRPRADLDATDRDGQLRLPRLVEHHDLHRARIDHARTNLLP